MMMARAKSAFTSLFRAAGVSRVMQGADMTLLDLSEAKAIQEAQARASVPVEVKESLSPSLFGLTSGDSEDARFRRITSPATLRDLNPVMHERMQQVSFFL